MALSSLSRSIVPAHSPNDCLDQLAQKLSSILDPAGLQTVYGYRTMPGQTVASASITSGATIPIETAVLEATFDYYIVVMVKILDGSNGKPDLEAAERRLNAIMWDAWLAIHGPNLPYWGNCYPFAADKKPGAPQEMVNYRQGVLSVRIEPK